MMIGQAAASLVLLAALIVPAAPSGPCQTASDVQARIDSVADGNPTGDPWRFMRTKLNAAPQAGFTVVDFTGGCYLGDGTISVVARRGLWIVRPETAGWDWTIQYSTHMVISGIAADTLTVADTHWVRVEATNLATLSVSDSDMLAGKLYADTATFDGLSGFARNSAYGQLELTGMMGQGEAGRFTVANSTWQTLTDTASGSYVIR